MLFDTDVLIWVLRGNTRAARALDAEPERSLSVISYMELIQGARDARDLKAVKAFLSDQAFQLLPLSENIGHRASIYMEEYALKGALSMADALIAATAVENQSVLCTGNEKHYKTVRDLDIRLFRP